jgi:hypothetical protein
MDTILSQMPNRQNFRMGRYTLEIGYPWLTYGAIVAIEGLIKSSHNVLELGCGGSTLFWSKRCNSVKSYDTNAEWITKVKYALPRRSNVKLVWGEVKYLSRRLRKEPNEYYDWLLADTGPLYKIRFHLMKKAIPKLKKGGYLVIDNYASGHMNRFDYTGWDVYTFDTIPPYSGRGTRICIKP